MEAQMNALTGQELEALLDGYHRLSHEFELLGGYTYRSEVTGILKGLGFSESEFDRQMSELSGGQKTRVSLGKLLVTKPTSCFWTSRPTIWIWNRSGGWRDF